MPPPPSEDAPAFLNPDDEDDLEDDVLLEAMDTETVTMENASAAVAQRAAKWARPAAPLLNPAKDALQFMQVRP